MPLLEGHEFIASGGLHVSYRASSAPQVLRVDVSTAGKSTRRSAPLIIKRLLELINAGAAGGSLFAPIDGKAERLTGPWDGPDAFGPEYRWVLRVSSVAPLFLRTMIDQLRRCGWDQPVTQLRIQGELAAQRGPKSVDVRAMRWLAKPDLYVDEWAPLGFSVRTQFAEHAGFSVRLAAKPSHASIEALKLVAVRWVVATAAYVDDAAKPVLRAREHLEQHLPEFTIDDHVFSARYAEFHHRALPARAVLVNMLQRFTDAQAPVDDVLIEHPATAKQKRPRK